jgi:hypothetical protein
MPTANIVSSHSEFVLGNSGTSLAASAAVTTGTSVGNTANTLIPTYFHFGAIGLYYNYRAFLGFDLSGESGTITGLTLTLYRRISETTPELYIIASQASDDIATSDYLDGIDGEDGYPFTDDATQFTDSPWNPNADGGGDGDAVTITLNSEAITAAQAVMGSGKFKLAIVNTYDFNNTYASSGITQAGAVQGVYFSSTQHGTSGLHPVLNVTTAGAAVTPNATINVKSGKITTNGGSIKINQ